MRYLSDGIHLFEVTREQADRNYGIAGGVILTTVLRDVASGQVAPVDELNLLALEEVRV